MTQAIEGVDVCDTLGCSSVLLFFSFITPVVLATASTPESANTIETKPFQLCSQPPCNGRRLCKASPRCGSVKQPRRTTTTTVGTETRKAKPAECLGPQELIAPMRRIATAAQSAGLGQP